MKKNQEIKEQIYEYLCRAKCDRGTAGKGVSVGKTLVFCRRVAKIVLWMVISTHISPIPAGPCEAHPQLHINPIWWDGKGSDRVSAGIGVPVGKTLVFFFSWTEIVLNMVISTHI
jgi:hypothetical protein